MVIFVAFAISFVLAEPEPLFGGRRGYGGYGGYRGGYRGGYGGRRGGHYGKRSAEPEAVADPEAAAAADPYYRGYGYGSYGGYRGYGGYGGHRGYYGGYYGKRSAEPVAEANPDAVADADPYYGGYGYGGYGGYGGYRGYGGYGGHRGYYGGYYGKRSAEPAA